ncbi:MAG: ROK family protein, partial [Bacilli bacterium]
MFVGGIEAGGTKFVCGVGTSSGEIIARESFPTTTPEETLQHVAEFFGRYDIEALGVGAFGPIDLTTESKTYGQIMATPKLKWRNFDLLGALKKIVNVPIAIDTDVNAAALAEQRFGAAQGVDSSIYIT